LIKKKALFVRLLKPSFLVDSKGPDCLVFVHLSTNFKGMAKQKLKLVSQDPWLEPNAKDIEDRYNRYRGKLKFIENDFNSLDDFADGYTYLGINYDTKQKGWTYREWAPQANALFLTGDFNNWEKYSCPLTKNEFGVWEVFLDEKTYGTTFTHGSKIKVLVDSQKGQHFRIPAYITRVIQDEDTKNFSGQLWFPKKFSGKAPQSLEDTGKRSYHTLFGKHYIRTMFNTATWPVL